MPDGALEHTMWNNMKGGPEIVINMELKASDRITE